MCRSRLQPLRKATGDDEGNAITRPSIACYCTFRVIAVLWVRPAELLATTWIVVEPEGVVVVAGICVVVVEEELDPAAHPLTATQRLKSTNSKQLPVKIDRIE